jgi:hypothetical protein
LIIKLFVLIVVVAVYQQSHPEYAAYLYLMAPISLAILNPLAFVLMEISKEKDSSSHQVATHQDLSPKPPHSNLRMAGRVVRGIMTNPIVFMTTLGIVGNFIFHHHLPEFLSGILKVIYLFLHLSFLYKA